MEMERDAERIQKEAALVDKLQMEARVEQLQKELGEADQGHRNEVKIIQDKLTETTDKLDRLTKVSCWPGQ